MLNRYLTHEMPRYHHMLTSLLSDAVWVHRGNAEPTHVADRALLPGPRTPKHLA